MARSRIHNMDTLDKEICRLKLQQKDQESSLRRQFSDLRKKGMLRILGFALLGRRKKFAEKDDGIFSSFTRSERLNRFMSRFADHLSGRFAGRADDLIDRLFRKKKR